MKTPRETLLALADPIKRPGAYSLHLYCKYKNPEHGFREFPHEVDQFQTRQEAERWARKRGWILHRDGLSTCPKCARAMENPDA